MATIATLDTIEDASARKDQQGWHVTRRAVVTGLDADVSAQARMVQAATVVGIPQYGDFAPGIPAPFVSVVASIDAAPLSTTSATVTISYEPIGLAGLTETSIDEVVGTGTPGGARISIRTALQSVTTNKDQDGNRIVLKHTRYRWKETLEIPLPPGQAGPPTLIHRQGDLRPQVGEVQTFIPVVVLTFRRREPTNPRAKAMNFIGRVDPDTIFGDPSRSWMCTRLDGESTDGDQTWPVVYEFTRAVEPKGPIIIDGVHQPSSGWDPVVSIYDYEHNTFFEDPVPELPVPTDGIIGIKQIKLALEADFEDLNLLVPNE
jgi:hypothetical protein